MEKYKYVIPEEAQDVIMNNIKKIRKMETELNHLFVQSGYDEVFMPTFEYTDLYREVSMGFSIEQLFQFFNNEGKAIALRADFTLPLARYFAYSKETIGRYCYFGKVYRKQISHKGRASEIFQAGFELMGLDEMTGDQECLELLAKSLDQLHMQSIKIEMGSAAFFERLEELLDDQQGVLKTILKRRDMSAMTSLVNEKLANKKIDASMGVFLNQLITLCGQKEVLEVAKVGLEDEILLATIDHLEKIYETYAPLFNDLTIDLAMVPKFSYYTGIMIQGYTSKAAEAVISGGRYDRLSGVFDKDTKAIGISYNLDLLSEMENADD